MWPHEKPETHFTSHRLLLDNPSATNSCRLKILLTAASTSTFWRTHQSSRVCCGVGWRLAPLTPGLVPRTHYYLESSGRRWTGNPPAFHLTATGGWWWKSWSHGVTVLHTWVVGGNLHLRRSERGASARLAAKPNLTLTGPRFTHARRQIGQKYRSLTVY